MLDYGPWREENETNLAPPLGVLVEEIHQALKLLWDALHVVKSINAQQHLLASELLLELPDALPVVVGCVCQLACLVQLLLG